MTNKITELTKEQEAQMKPHADKWIAIGLDTTPADFDGALPYINKCYEFSDLKEPKFAFTVSSPKALCTISPILMTISPTELAKLPKHLSLDMDFVVNALKNTEIVKLIKENYNKYIGGNTWAAWPATEEFYRKVCGLTLEGNMSQRGEAYAEVSKRIAWWYPTDNFVVMCDKPAAIRMENDVLHSPNGYAIEWRDGEGICSWRGTEIPSDWMFGKTPTAKELLRWENIEQRRAGCEIVGWNVILAELHAVSIDKDPDPQIGELLEVDLPGSGKERFLKVECGTGRIFAIPVPPDMQTALEANLATYGITDLSMKPEIRT